MSGWRDRRRPLRHRRYRARDLEFVENAVEHGYATDVSKGIVVEAALAGDGNVRASVIDRGQWKDHRDGARGRGRGLAWPRP